MISFVEFNVLTDILKNGYAPQKALAQHVGISVGTVNKVVNQLRQRGLLDGNEVTDAAVAELAPYHVDNAIILAAGMSTRFVPFSYEHPKGLTVVKGDVLIERQICQLQQAGVSEIIIVVGHMLEKFLYLGEKYGVKFVVNGDYRTKNTHSSLYFSREYLKNTYICCSDIYYPVNPFRAYEYRATYCAQYLDGVSRTERGLISDSTGLIVATEKPTKNSWIMAGHAYFDHSFSSTFRPILERYYGQPGTDSMYWETIYAEQPEQLPMYIRKCADNEILEFDSANDLQRYDPHYISHNSTHVIRNICRALKIEPDEISNIVPISGGLTNRSFRFECRGTQYVYRNPGSSTIGYIDRERELFALQAARQLGLDKSFICGEPKEGWKISLFVNETEKFDFRDPAHLSGLCALLRRLHTSGICCGKPFDYYDETRKLIDKLRPLNFAAAEELEVLYAQFRPIADTVRADGWPVQLCHNDIYEPNILVSGEDIYLIDWEYAGDTDIGFDICKLFATIDAPLAETAELLSVYFGRSPTDAECTHVIGCAALNYLYWYVWAVYMTHTGNDCPDYALIWYEKMKKYMNEVLHRMEEN